MLAFIVVVNLFVGFIEFICCNDEINKTKRNRREEYILSDILSSDKIPQNSNTMEDVHGFNLEVTSENSTFPPQCQCQCMFSQSSSEEKLPLQRSTKQDRKTQNSDLKFKKFKLEDEKKDKNLDDCCENVLSFFCVCCE